MKKDLTLGSPLELFTRRMFTAIIRRLSAFLAEADFSISEIAALHVVGASEGISVQALGEQLNLSTSATSRLVSKLVERGYFLRKADAKDARVKVITCARKGEQLLDKLSIERLSAVFAVAETLPTQIPEGILGAISLYKKGD